MLAGGDLTANGGVHFHTGAREDSPAAAEFTTEAPRAGMGILTRPHTAIKRY